MCCKLQLTFLFLSPKTLTWSCQCCGPGRRHTAAVHVGGGRVLGARGAPQSAAVQLDSFKTHVESAFEYSSYPVFRIYLQHNARLFASILGNFGRFWAIFDIFGPTTLVASNSSLLQRAVSCTRMVSISA